MGDAFNDKTGDQPGFWLFNIETAAAPGAPLFFVRFFLVKIIWLCQ
jgi:hypothetical protein